MADNVAQSIKELQKDLAALDKQLLSNNANWDKLGQTIVDSLKRGGLGLDDLFSKMKSQKDVIKLRAIIDRDALMDDVKKLQTAVDKGVKSVKVGGVEITGQKQIEQALDGYKSQLKLVPKTLAEAYDYAVKIANTLSGAKDKGGTAWSRARADEMNARKKAIDDVTRTEGRLLKLEQELSRYKEGGSRWKNVKSQIEAANKELEVYREKLKLLASRGKSALDANIGTVGFSKETKQLIQEGRDATREAERLAKVRQKDAEWQEQQRRNTEAQFVANGKAIEQQRKLADQIDILTRKRQALARYTTDNGMAFDSRNYQLATAYQKQIEDLIRLRQQLDRQFSGSMKAGDLAFADTKTLRDNEEMQKRITAEQIQRDKERSAAAKERAAIERKADSESIANQRRQIQIKAQLSAIDKARNSDRNISSNRAKTQIAEENAEYKRLSAELTRLIARQKELNALSQGSGSRARGRLQTYEITASEQALRRYEDAWRRVNREQKKSDDNMKRMLSTVSRLASAFGVAFSVRGLVNFGKKLAETRGEFEMQQVALRSILQNKQLADDIWEKTMKAALQSPFTAMQLTKYTKQLAAYRIESEKLFDTTRRLADVSAGLGVDMQRLILAYGQVKAANYLRASEIRQFTEAGVNVLGELRDYFNDFKGMSVDTAKVMEMVQKRMVKFEDVEAIFKRMTDQGGIFYNMQYIQSQTVQGQIKKLHDAYDQMLNSMGKDNEGLLKGFVSTLNSMVKNWRTLKVVIESIGWAAAVGYITKYASALTGLEKASTGTLRNIAKLKSLFSSKWAIGLGSFTAIATLLYGLNSRMKDTNKEIDEQILRLYETRKNYIELKEKIEDNNKTIQSGTKEQKKLNEAQKSNKNIIKKLKEEYPQIASQMDIATNGVIKFNNALEVTNRKLSEQMTLVALQKQSDIFSDSMQKNQQEAESELAATKARIAAIIAEATTEIANLEAKGITSGGLYDALKALESFKQSKNVLQDMKSLGPLVEKAVKSGSYYISKSNAFAISGLGLGNVKSYTEQLSGQFALLKSYYENGIKDNSEYFKEINENYGGSVSLFIKENIERINTDTKEGVNKANEILISSLKPQTEEMKAYLNVLLNQAFGYVTSSDVAKLPSLFVQNILKGSFEGLKESMKSIAMVDFFSESIKGLSNTKLTPEEIKQKNDSDWRRRIQLLEEMKRRYDELSKSAYGYTKSEKTVRKAFDESFKEIFKDTGIMMSQIDFTSMAGMMESMKLALSKAKGISDAVREEIMKKIDSYETQITINAQVKIREDFGRQMEKAFGDYELTLELEKLNIPGDVLSDLFDKDTVRLYDLRKKVADYYENQVKLGADPTELVKQVEGYYNKIDDMERKQQQQRIKDYAKYLEYEMSERAKIEMEYVRKVGEVMSNTAFTSQQKENINERLKEERKKAIAKQDWEDFKGSETYVQMMEDLEGHGVEALQAMRVELEKVRDNAENLSPRALKEVVNAIEKIRKIELQKENPFRRLSEAQADLKAARENAEKAGVDTDKSRKELSEEEGAARRLLMDREKELNVMQSKMGAQKKLKDYEKERLELEKKFSLEKYGYDIASVKTGAVDNTSSSNTLYGKILFQTEKIKAKEDEIAEKREQILDAERKLAQEMEKGEKKDNFKVRLYSDQIEMLNQLFHGLRNDLEVLNAERNQLQEILNLRIKEAEAKLEAKDISDEDKKRLEDEIAQLKEKLRLLGIIVDKQKDVDEAWKNIANNVSQIASGLSSVYNSFKGMMNSFGEDTETGAWATADAAMTTVDALGNVASKIASGDWLGAAFSAIGGIFDSISAWVKAGDAELQDTIESEQKRIENLKDAYARLEKQIEKTWSGIGYMRTYEQQTNNIREQIEATKRQLSAERAKKDSDENAIRQYKRYIQDLLDQLDDLRQKQIEVFGGVAEINYRSVAEGFVEAWKSAFLETGDGLEALQDHFDEFLQDWFVKQATMQGVSSYYKEVFDYINSVVEDGSIPSYQQIENARALADEAAEKSNELMQIMAGIFGIGSEGSLSGLAQGIQGITEEQANILEAYWNSVRMYTASIDMNVARIAEMLGAGGVNSNPMLMQLQTIANNTAYIQDIYNLLNGTRRNLGNGQGFITYNQ